MSISALCIGDVHIQTNNISQIQKFFHELENLIQTRMKDIDIIVLMGDILHTHERLHTIAFNHATELFKMLSSHKPTYVLVGNHDLINNSQFMTDNHWMNCFKPYNNLHIIDTIRIETFNGIKLTFCPYVPDGQFLQALNQKQGQWEDSKCIFGHQLFDGVKMGAIVSENVEKWDIEHPLIISGHIHDKQKVQDNLIYTGSSMQHAFGESNDKTLLLVKIQNEDKCTFEELELDVPKKKIIYLETEDLDKLDVNEILEKHKNTELKLTINGCIQDFESFKKTLKYKEITKKNLKIVFKQKRLVLQQKKQNLDESLENNKEKPKSFHCIFEELIRQENNPYLEKLMSTIIHNKKNENADDILFL